MKTNTKTEAADNRYSEFHPEKCLEFDFTYLLLKNNINCIKREREQKYI